MENQPEQTQPSQPTPIAPSVTLTDQNLKEMLILAKDAFMIYNEGQQELTKVREENAAKLAALEKEVEKTTLQTLKSIDYSDKILKGVVVLGSLGTLVFLSMNKAIDNGVIAIMSSIFTAVIVSNSNVLFSSFIKKRSSNSSESHES